MNTEASESVAAVRPPKLDVHNLRTRDRRTRVALRALYSARELPDLARALVASLGGEARTPAVALEDVSFTVPKGQALALVGESQDGQDELLAVLRGQVRPFQGHVRLDSTTRVRVGRRLQTMQVLAFQSRGAFAPDRTLRHGLASDADGSALADIDAIALAMRVSLSPALLDAPAAALTATELRLASIARALATGAEVLVLDEPWRGLDAAAQARVTGVLQALKDSGLTLLVLTSGWIAAALLAEQTGVLCGGRLVELGATADVITAPAHPYTRALLDASPDRLTRRAHAPLTVLHDGDPPDSAGCVLATRCPLVTASCRTQPPQREPVAPPARTGAVTHVAACPMTRTLASAALSADAASEGGAPLVG